MSIILQIIKKSILKPGLMLELANEKAEIKDDKNHKTHTYSFDFDSIENFFLKEKSNVNIQDFEDELLGLEKHVEKFFNKMNDKKYPSKERPYPIDYSINSDSRKFLYILCRIIKPKNIIETGVAYGLSSYYILSALEKNRTGTLCSIDSVFRPWQSEEMIGAIIPTNLRSRWKLVLGKSNEKLLETFNKINDVDIFIHDSLHSYKNMTFEFDCAFEKISNNGIIISDDILDNDAFYDFIKDKKIKKSSIKVQNSGLGVIQKI